MIVFEDLKVGDLCKARCDLIIFPYSYGEQRPIAESEDLNVGDVFMITSEPTRGHHALSMQILFGEQKYYLHLALEKLDYYIAKIGT